MSKNDTLRFLAYNDRLTEMENRTAFDFYSDKLDSELINIDNIAMIVFDINGLKEINDIYGHAEGDCIIKGCANTINTAYGSIGRIFRIGGDEFVFISLDSNSEKLSDASKIFLHEIDKYNLSSPKCKLGVAYGLAHYNPQTDKCMHDIFLKSDAEMYQNKSMQKHQLV